jgi:hypothetical protein
MKPKITDAQVAAAAAKIRSGSTLADVSKALKLDYGRLQGALQRTFGAKGYKTLMAGSKKKTGRAGKAGPKSQLRRAA